MEQSIQPEENLKASCFMMTLHNLVEEYATKFHGKNITVDSDQENDQENSECEIHINYLLCSELHISFSGGEGGVQIMQHS